jgi:predicted component of type VI protein secretion system
MLVSALTRVRQQETDTCVTTHPPFEPGAVSTVPVQWSTRSVCVVVVLIATVAALAVRRIVLAREKTMLRAVENVPWKRPKLPNWLRRLGAASDHALS